LSAVGWMALALSSMQEAVARTHYSVDMLLATAVTWLIWRKPPWASDGGEKRHSEPNQFLVRLLPFLMSSLVAGVAVVIIVTGA